MTVALMTIKPASVSDIRQVASNMRERDLEEFSATTYANTREELAELLAARYGAAGDVLCGYYAGKPTCIGGTYELWPNVITLLFYATDDFPKIGLGVSRFIKKNLFPRFFALGVNRIQAVSHAEHAEAHRWLKVLGLEKEAEFPKYGKGGETFYQFAKVI